MLNLFNVHAAQHGDFYRFSPEKLVKPTAPTLFRTVWMGKGGMILWELKAKYNENKLPFIQSRRVSNDLQF